MFWAMWKLCLAAYSKEAALWAATQTGGYGCWYGLGPGSAPAYRHDFPPSGQGVFPPRLDDGLERLRAHLVPVLEGQIPAQELCMSTPVPAPNSSRPRES